MRPNIIVGKGKVTIQDFKVQRNWKEWRGMKRRQRKGELSSFPFIVYEEHKDGPEFEVEMKNCSFNSTPRVVGVWSWLCRSLRLHRLIPKPIGTGVVIRRIKEVSA